MTDEGKENPGEEGYDLSACLHRGGLLDGGHNICKQVSEGLAIFCMHKEAATSLHCL